MPTSPDFEQLLAQAQETERRTGDTKVVDYIEDLKKSTAGLAALLSHKTGDPIRELRKHWDEMAHTASELLKKIDDQQQTREKELRNLPSVRANRGKALRSAEPDAPTSLKAAAKHVPEVPDFTATGEQLKALQKQSEKKVEDVARVTDQLGSDLRGGLLASVKALGEDARRLRWVLRRMKAARLASGTVRALLSVITFLALYLLLLWLHHPVAEFAQDLIQGSLTAFGLLAALLLPIELIKAFLIEPIIHSLLHKWERTRTRIEFDKLITLLARTRIAIAKAND